jgi:hypothetical protein
MSDVKIIGNTGAYAGGGIYNYGKMKLAGVTIAKNNATRGGGIEFTLYAEADFDTENRCNIYSNTASYEGDDLRYHWSDTTKIAIVVDTFTVLNPTNEKAYPLWKYDFDILHEISEATNIDIKNKSLPTKFALKQNYPNPFNPITNIEYQIPYSELVELSIYNLLGQKVTTLVNNIQTAGRYQVQWDASGFASGIYIYRLKVQGQKQNAVFTKKLVLLK